MWLKINKIRTKLQLYFFLLILIAAAIGWVSFVYIHQIWKYHTLRKQVDQLLVINPKLIKSEQNFLFHDSKEEYFHKTGESTNLNKYHSYMRKTRLLLSDIEENPLIKKLNVQKNFQSIRQLFASHHQVFMDVFAKLKLRGYRKAGLEGKMLESFIVLQKADSLNQVSLLTLRKHEKDFFIRKDLNLVDSLVAESERLITITRDSVMLHIRKKELLTGIRDTLSLANLNIIAENVRTYVKYFEKIVQIDNEIGFDEKSGLLGILLRNTQKIEFELSSMDAHIDLKTRDLFESSTLLMLLFFLIILCISIVFAFIIAYRITHPIVRLHQITQSVHQGIQHQDQLLDKIKSNDEVGSIAKNVKFILLRLKKALHQVNERNRKLEEFAQTEALRIWHSEGLTIFGEIFRNHQDSLENQAFQIISELVKYTQSAQGGLFIVNKSEEYGEEFLELKSCYAYDRKKYQQKRIDWGEGLVGTAWRENRTIFITDIPADYTFIHTGLGKVKPSSLLIVPIQSDNQMAGVIELVSLKAFQPHEIEFIETLSHRIANALLTIQSNERTKKLLAISEEIAANAQEQEAKLHKQLEDYQFWVKEFEQKLNTVSEESIVYQAVINNVYAGLIITDEKFQILQVNNYITKRFNYRKRELLGQFIDVLIEADYKNVFDLKDRQFKLNFKSINQKSLGKVIDKRGKIYEVETLIGKLDLDTKLIYVFLFNELVEDSQQVNGTTSTATKEINLKVAS